MIQPERILKFIRLLVLLVIPAIVTIESACAGHPFHSTFTEMEWNRASGRFEVAVQLPGLQIDDELSRLHKRRINLETAEDSERLLQEYIQSRFSVTGKGQGQCQLHWVGMEIDTRNVWAYFEVELSGGDLQGTSVIPTKPQTEEVPIREVPIRGLSSSSDRPSIAPENSAPNVTAAPVLPHSMPEELTIQCRFLVDSLPGQANMITVVDGPHRASAQLTSDQTGCTAVNNHSLEVIESRELN